MKKILIIFLQAVIVLIGIVAVTVLIRFPLTEGRATNLDVFAIYSNPFILFGYTGSIAFFIALYKAFRLLGYIGQNRIFSSSAAGTLKSIRICAIFMSIIIITAGIYVMMFHSKDDDPAGFIVICMVTFLISMVVATAATISERILRKAIEMKSENDLTI